jgi:nicotinamidase-related amidase
MLRRTFRALVLAGSLTAGAAGGAAAQTPPEEYLKPLTPDNAAFLFIDNQTKLMMAVQSIDHTVLMRNTEGLARLAAVFKSPVVLTTTGGGAKGPAGALYPAITRTFPNAPVIDRQLYFNAMSDPAFAEAVKKTGKKKVILSGISTDYCLVYPAQTLIDQGYHVFIVVDASGSWTKQIDDAALARLEQMGATLINTQAIAGEMQNALAVKDPKLAMANQPALLNWFSLYQPGPALMVLGAPAPGGL